MEDFAVQPLSKGLGFYEKPAFDKTEGELDLLKGKIPVHGQSLGPLLAQIPESLLQETTTPQKEEADNKLFQSKTKVTDVQRTAQSSISPNTRALQKISPWLKAVGLMDVLTAGLFFFPSFILFAFLTETAVLSVLSLLWPKILLAFLFFVQMYCFICRLFCFETLGEALAKIRLAPKGSKGPAHPLPLFFHFVLSCATGFVLLPLLSLVLKKDLTGYLTGLQFQKTS